MKKIGPSYDDLLRNMMIAYNRQKLATRARGAREGTGEWRKLDDAR